MPGWEAGQAPHPNWRLLLKELDPGYWDLFAVRTASPSMSPTCRSTLSSLRFRSIAFLWIYLFSLLLELSHELKTLSGALFLEAMSHCVGLAEGCILAEDGCNLGLLKLWA